MNTAEKSLKRRMLMQFALLINHTPEEFAIRKNDYNDPHLGAWRAYYRALVEAGVYVGANALEVPETGTTYKLGRDSAVYRMAPMPTPRSNWEDLSSSNSLPLTRRSNGLRAARVHR
jgi:hypothetical protein